LPEFDRLLREWLVAGSEEVKTILLKHASSPYDRDLISETFYVAPESTIQNCNVPNGTKI